MPDFMEWISWSSSNSVPYKSSEKGIGHGERKLASEPDLDITGCEPLGQNSRYDFIDSLQNPAEAKQIERRSIRVRGKAEELTGRFIGEIAPVLKQLDVIVPELSRRDEKIGSLWMPNGILGRNMSQMLFGMQITHQKICDLVELLNQCRQFIKEKNLQPAEFGISEFHNHVDKPGDIFPIWNDKRKLSTVLNDVCTLYLVCPNGYLIVPRIKFDSAFVFDRMSQGTFSYKFTSEIKKSPWKRSRAKRISISSIDGMADSGDIQSKGIYSPEPVENAGLSE